MVKTAGIMGGTFDPPHLGHIKIAESFLNSGIIDRLIVIPVFVPPHKANTQTDYPVRLEMARSAFSDIKNAEVSDVESRLPVPSYTFNTVTHLIKVLPDTKLYICMGSDNLDSFHQWYKYDELLEMCSLIVAERPGNLRKKLPAGFTGKVHFVQHDLVEASATNLRENARDSVQSSGLIPENVQKIIDRENLYSNS